MPSVETRAVIPDLVPVSTAITKVDGCITKTVSGYGLFTYEVNYTRDPQTKEILSVQHLIADA